MTPSPSDCQGALQVRCVSACSRQGGEEPECSLVEVTLGLENLVVLNRNRADENIGCPAGLICLQDLRFARQSGSVSFVVFRDEDA